MLTAGLGAPAAADQAQTSPASSTAGQGPRLLLPPRPPPRRRGQGGRGDCRAQAGDRARAASPPSCGRSSPAVTPATTAQRRSRRRRRRSPGIPTTRKPTDSRHDLRRASDSARRSRRATIRRIPARAIAALEKARKDDAFDINLDLMLGRLYAQTGAFDKALPLLQHVVDDQPQISGRGAAAGRGAGERGQADDAIQTLAQDARGNPDFYRGQLRLAETDERAEKWAEAAGRSRRRWPQYPEHGARSAPRDRADQRRQGGRSAGASGEAGRRRRRAGPGDDLPARRSAARRQGSVAAEATARKLLAAEPGDKRGLHVLSSIQQERATSKGAERRCATSSARIPRTPTRSIRSATCSPSAAIASTKRCSCCNAR